MGIVMMFLGMVVLFFTLLHKAGLTQRLWDWHVHNAGKNWFEGLILLPLGVIFTAVVIDLAVRSEQAWIARRLQNVFGLQKKPKPDPALYHIPFQAGGPYTYNAPF